MVTLRAMIATDHDHDQTWLEGVEKYVFENSYLQNRLFSP
jgi:hypothetical protein